jgi:maltokinase
MDSTLACLAAWMPRQRWYAAKGRPPSLRLVSWWDLAPATDADAGARIRTYLVADEGALPAVLYQLPVVSRATETVDASPDHIIGSPEPGTTFIDGPHDPAYTRALYELVTAGGSGEGPQTVATGHPGRHARAAAALSATVMSGEQSNTSLIYR